MQSYFFELGSPFPQECSYSLHGKLLKKSFLSFLSCKLYLKSLNCGITKCYTVKKKFANDY